MKSYYSIIRFVNNPLSKENIAIGMIVISKGSIFYRFSKEKITITKKINSNNSNLLEYTIDKISNFIDLQIKEEVSLFSKEVNVNLEYLNRLSIYNNGFLQIDNPSIINLEFDNNRFDSFFQKYIELNLRETKKAVIDRSFKTIINNIFYKPLYNVIDLDYKIRKEQIPNLFFDYTLDGIGVNGSVYSLKSIDLNSEKPIDSFRRDISDLESLNYRIDLFSKENNLDSENNQHYLVIDPYKGSKSSHHKLYNILIEQDNEDYPYTIINTNSLETITKRFQKARSIIKFSDYIETLD